MENRKVSWFEIFKEWLRMVFDHANNHSCKPAFGGAARKFLLHEDDTRPKTVATNAMVAAHDAARNAWRQRGWNRKHGCKEQSQQRAAAAQDLNDKNVGNSAPVKTQGLPEKKNGEAI